MRFKQLGSPSSHDVAMASELRLARITPVKLRGYEGKYAATVGIIEFDCGQVIVFERDWDCYHVHAAPFSLPYEQAKLLNDVMRKDVRVDGQPGGGEVKTEGCKYWQVDTYEGFMALVLVLLVAFGEQLDELDPTTPELALSMVTLSST